MPTFSGPYSCIASSDLTEIDVKTAELKVIDVPPTTQNGTIYTIAANDTAISCSVTGNPLADIMWYKV